MIQQVPVGIRPTATSVFDLRGVSALVFTGAPKTRLRFFNRIPSADPSDGSVFQQIGKAMSGEWFEQYDWNYNPNICIDVGDGEVVDLPREVQKTQVAIVSDVFGFVSLPDDQAAGNVMIDVHATEALKAAMDKAGVQLAADLMAA